MDELLENQMTPIARPLHGGDEVKLVNMICKNVIECEQWCHTTKYYLAPKPRRQGSSSHNHAHAMECTYARPAASCST